MQRYLRQIMDEKLPGGGNLEFSCTEVSLVLTQGAPYEGTFTVIGSGQGVSKGYLLSTDRRVECLTTEFAGAEETIAFRVHTEGFEEGEEAKGFFQIVSNRGEYELPFLITVQRPALVGMAEEVENLTQFAALAHRDWLEAVRLFYLPEFEVILQENQEVLTLYQALSGVPGNQSNVEEFLIACGKKVQVDYLTLNKELKIENPIGVAEYELQIFKNGWGYTLLTVHTEGNFLYVEKEQLTDDDFLGNRCILFVYVDSSQLHLGKNLGRITLSGVQKEITIPVTVSVLNSAGETAKKAKLEREGLLAELTKVYLAYRLKKTTAQEWLRKTGRLVEQMTGLDDRDYAARLYQAQVLITEERFREADWILNRVRDGMDQEEYDPRLMAYYLYLTTLADREPGCTREAATHVEELYRQNKGEWRIAWLMLFLSPELNRSPSAKWDFLEKQFKAGCTSPVLYLEFLQMMNYNPAFLRRLGKEELRVLFFGSRYEKLSGGLMDQVLYLAGKVREYSLLLLKILESWYEVEPTEAVLTEICAQLIKGGRTDRKASDWYEKGVEAQIRITRLYEYYMLSVDLEGSREISRKALLYFSYQSDLDSEHAAYLYSYVQKNKTKDPQLYAVYSERMERFVIDQLKRGRISRHLAYLYQELLSPKLMDQQLSEAFLRLLGAYSVQFDKEGINRILVFRPGMIEPEEFGKVGDRVYVTLFHKEDVVVLEDRAGNRYVKSVPMNLEKLLDKERCMALTLNLLGKDQEEKSIIPVPKPALPLSFAKYLWEQTREHKKMTELMALAGEELIASGKLTTAYRREVYKSLLTYYMDCGDTRRMDQCLEKLYPQELDGQTRRLAMEAFASRGMWEKAYEWLAEYGPQAAEERILLRLLDDRLEREGAKDEPFLLESCMYAFRKESYDGLVLSYLAEHFLGLTREMEELLFAARSFGTDTGMLCENILVQSIFSGKTLSDRMEIFQEYVANGADPFVEELVITDCCRKYLLSEESLDAFVVREICNRYHREEKLKRVVRLAFLKYASGSGEGLGGESQVVRALVKDMMKQGIHLNCFKGLRGCDDLLEELWDKQIVEFVTQEDEEKLKIHYAILQDRERAERFLTGELVPVTDGLFIKEFVLFFDERVQYFITKEQDGEENIVAEGVLHKDERTKHDPAGRYENINEILMASALGEYDRLDGLLEEYYEKDYIGSRLFSPR